MNAHLLGYTLFIDQASNAAGVALTLDGELLGTETIRSLRSTDVISARLQHQIPLLTDFINKYVPRHRDINRVVFEGVRARLVLISVGAFLMCPRIKARLSPTDSFVETGSWKNWAKKQGATGKTKDIKGLRSLREIRPELFNRYKIKTDDEADSVMMWLTFKDRYE